MTVPILVYAIGLDPVPATSYSLFIVGISSLAGAFNNYRKGLVNVRTALLFGVSSITTVLLIRKFLIPLIPANLFQIGSRIITHSTATMILFALLMLLSAWAMISDISEEVVSKPLGKTNQISILLLYGVIVGSATGLLGAGGGFLIIPALVLVLKMTMKEAVGTSLLIIALNSLVGFCGDIGHFRIQWNLLLGITALAVTGIFIGGLIGRKLSGD